ncbi:MAG: replication/maintenance protein RepL [Defluviitaleaceae bacterium]|nr:replication/maintenance protein RepL [Defluviitaleaceae bacterium]
MITSKKQKFVGHKILVDRETGEEYPMQLNMVEERDFNFHKVWLQHLVNSVDGIANQKLKLAFWIIDNLDKENKLVMTQRKISEKSGMSYQTVSRTMRALQDGSPSFLQKINSGAYKVNPDVMFKGSHSNRMGILYEYRDLEAENKKAKEQPLVTLVSQEYLEDDGFSEYGYGKVEMEAKN